MHYYKKVHRWWADGQMVRQPPLLRTSTWDMSPHSRKIFMTKRKLCPCRPFGHRRRHFMGERPQKKCQRILRPLHIRAQPCFGSSHLPLPPLQNFQAVSHGLDSTRRRKKEHISVPLNSSTIRRREVLTQLVEVRIHVDYLPLHPTKV